MLKFAIIIGIGALMMLGIGFCVGYDAHAQSYPVMVQPLGNGYVLSTPGQAPVSVQPWLNGYTYGQIGGPQTTVTPFGQGYIVTPPIGQQQPLVPLFGGP